MERLVPAVAGRVEAAATKLAAGAMKPPALWRLRMGFPASGTPDAYQPFPESAA
jgi:hypothetical protein